MTTLGNDTFTRANQSGWGTATDGQSWSVTTGAATLAISSNVGTVTACTSLTFIELGSTTSADAEALLRFAVPSTTITAAGIILRQTATNTAYRCRVNSNASAQGFGIIKTVAGTSTNLVTASFTPTLNAAYWMRFKIVGSDLYGRIWADGTTEPSTWTVQTTDSSITGAGGIGIVNNSSNSADVVSYSSFYTVDYTPGAFSIESGLDATGSVTASSPGNTNTGTDILTSLDATSGTNLGTTTSTDTLTSLTGTSGTNLGTNTGTDTLTLLTATGSVTASVPVVPPTTVSVTVGGTAVTIKEGSFLLDDAIDQRSICSFIIEDAAGTTHYQKGQQVVVTHSTLGTLFSGVINDAEEYLLYPNTQINTTVRCADNTWFADKRLCTNADYSTQYAGDIFTDLLSQLSAEGITANYATRRDATQTQLAQGTLSNTVATSNVGDGDVELASAGTALTFHDSGLIGNSTVAIKLQGTAAQGYNNNYVYRKIWAGSIAIASNDYLTYDVWVQSDSPQIQAGVDFVCTDGTTFRDNDGGSTDAQGIHPHPSNDLSGLATNTWYNRVFAMPSSLVGKTIAYVMVAFEGDTAGTYTAYFRNIQYSNFSTGIKQHLFDSTQNTIQTSSQVSINGYSSVTCTVVTAYSPVVNYVRSHSIDAAKLIKNSQISWQTALTSTTSTAAAPTVETSLDSGASWQRCTNFAAIPNLLAGMAVAGRTLQYRLNIPLGIDPTAASYFSSLTVGINPAYQASKTDVIRTFTSGTDWSTGTYSNTKTLNPGLTLNGYTRTFDDGTYSNQSIYGSFGGGQGIYIQTFKLTSAATADCRSRLDFAGTWSDFTAEVDVQISTTASTNSGLVYRTTNWGSSNDSYAYAATISATQIQLAKGSNSTGAGSFTSIASVSTSLQTGSWHRLKVVVSGSTHRVYVDDTLYINATDSTYSSAGYLGLRFYNGSASSATAYLDNFGLCASLSGTWTSPSISLTGATTYGTSQVLWDASGIVDGTSIKVETTINGGTSWQTIANNGDAIGNLTANQSLSGVSVQVRVTLTANNAPIQPILNGLTLWCQGAYSATGTRVSPALSLTNVGRAGSSLISWTATTPTSTSLGVDVSPDGSTWTDVSSGNGGSIPFITGQPAATDDTFSSNTSASYTSTNGVTGSVATWTYDTANSRLVATGGNLGVYLLNTLTWTDGEILLDLDQSDEGGCVWHWSNSSNYYALLIHDSAATTPGMVYLYKTASGTRSLLTTGSISFPRGTYKRFVVAMSGTTITASMDGNAIFTYTDSAALSGGQCGLRNGTNGAGSTARFYQMRVQPYGQSLSGQNVYSRLRLASTDPTATPQVLAVTASVRSPSIGSGSLIPSTSYQYQKYISDAMQDLAKQSTDYWWYIDKNKMASFRQRAGVPSSWILYSGSGDLLVSGLSVTNQADLYRNRQWVTGGVDTATITETRKGDGIQASWTMGYPLAAAPTITVNGVAALVGVKGIDTGKDFYYTIGSATITQDSSETPPDGTQTLVFAYSGQYTVTVMAEDTAEQSSYAALEGGSGIVEHVLDVSTYNPPLTKSACQQLATGELNRYKVRGRTLRFQTRKSGLASGQLLSVFLAEHGITDGLYLINRVQTRLRTLSGSTIDPLYDIEASEGPNLGDWVKLFQK